MRILVIAPEQLPVPPVKGGSVETCIHHIFRRMSRSQKIVLLSRAHRSLPSYSKRSGGRLTFIRVPQGNRYAYIKSALRRVRGRTFDLIQVENRPTFIPIVRKAFPRTPIVLSLHSLTFMNRLRKKQAKHILSKTNGVTSVSTFISKTMKRRFPGHARKFKTARLGVDLSAFRPRSSSFKQALRKRWGVGGTYNILFIGRIVPGKGLHTLVRAAALMKQRYRNIRLIAVGSAWPGVRGMTPYMRRVKRLSQQLRVPIRFTGYVPPKRIPKLYHLADVFVCPTQYREGFAMVNTEAMASGIPVIASRRGGITRVVQHGKSGLLVDSYTSPQAFAKRLIQLKASPALAKRLAAGGRKRVRSAFSWNHTVHQLLGHYRRWRKA